MAFYYKPPKGVLSIAKLGYGAKIRLQFLLGLHNCDGNVVLMKDLVEQSCTVEDSEWLIEGGKKDQVSHYTCRLACSQSPEMGQFFIHAETALFRYRITSMREEELLQTVKNIEKLFKLMKRGQSQLNKALQEVYDTINAVTKHHSLDAIVKEYFMGTDLIVPVPFQSVINLIRYRKVSMWRGDALVPVTSLPDILVPMFETLLQHGMKLAKQKIDAVKQDVRIKRLCLQLKNHLKCDDIDKASSAFPLCMSLLHHTLRKKHRLSHSARVQYTLFLKECSLPVNEAILFWQREYSKPALHGSCTHRWEKDSRRYVYSIRHLYGLEGSRKNYRGHSCASIQDFHTSCNQEGGCPFKHMDRENLSRQLAIEDLAIGYHDSVLEAAGRGQCGLACNLYLSGKTRRITDGASVRDIEEKATTEDVKFERLHVKTDEFECKKQDMQTVGSESEPKCDVNTMVQREKSVEMKVLKHDCEQTDVSMSLGCKMISMTNEREVIVCKAFDGKVACAKAESMKCTLDSKGTSESHQDVKLEKQERSGITDMDQEVSACVPQTTKGIKRPGTFEEQLAKRTKLVQAEGSVCCDSGVMRSPINFYDSYCRLLDGLS